MRVLRELRIIPVVLFAAICLLALKVIGLVRGDGYVLGSEPHLGEVLATRIADSRSPDPKGIKAAEPPARQSWAQEMFGFPDVTGSVPESKPADKPAAAIKKPVPAPKDPGGTPVNLDTSKPSSPAERALLERLQER